MDSYRVPRHRVPNSLPPAAAHSHSPRTQCRTWQTTSWRRIQPRIPPRSCRRQRTSPSGSRRTRPGRRPWSCWSAASGSGRPPGRACPGARPRSRSCSKMGGDGGERVRRGRGAVKGCRPFGHRRRAHDRGRPALPLFLSRAARPPRALALPLSLSLSLATIVARERILPPSFALCLSMSPSPKLTPHGTQGPYLPTE